MSRLSGYDSFLPKGEQWFFAPPWRRAQGETASISKNPSHLWDGNEARQNFTLRKAALHCRSALANSKREFAAQGLNGLHKRINL